MTNHKVPNRTGRQMNSQMNISLPVELHEKLRDLAWENRMPLSHLCRELIQESIRMREAGEAADSVSAAT